MLNILTYKYLHRPWTSSTAGGSDSYCSLFKQHKGGGASSLLNIKLLCLDSAPSLCEQLWGVGVNICFCSCCKLLEVGWNRVPATGKDGKCACSSFLLGQIFGSSQLHTRGQRSPGREWMEAKGSLENPKECKWTAYRVWNELICFLRCTFSCTSTFSGFLDWPAPT